jgi:hypothetical protein
MEIDGWECGLLTEEGKFEDIGGSGLIGEMPDPGERGETVSAIGSNAKEKVEAEGVDGMGYAFISIASVDSVASYNSINSVQSTNNASEADEEDADGGP